MTGDVTINPSASVLVMTTEVCIAIRLIYLLCGCGGLFRVHHVLFGCTRWPVMRILWERRELYHHFLLFSAVTYGLLMSAQSHYFVVLQVLLLTSAFVWISDASKATFLPTGDGTDVIVCRVSSMMTHFTTKRKIIRGIN